MLICICNRRIVGIKSGRSAADRNLCNICGSWGFGGLACTLGCSSSRSRRIIGSHTLTAVIALAVRWIGVLVVGTFAYPKLCAFADL